MKNIANCKPSEFLRQTNRIRKSVERWLTATDIMNIRKRKPRYDTAAEGATPEERAALVERNKEREMEQAKENLSAILDEILEKHPNETLEVLALCAFVEPENVDEYPVKEYLGMVGEILNDREILDFFTSLARLAQRNTGVASGA